MNYCNHFCFTTSHWLSSKWTQGIHNTASFSSLLQRGIQTQVSYTLMFLTASFRHNHDRAAESFPVRSCLSDGIIYFKYFKKLLLLCNSTCNYPALESMGYIQDPRTCSFTCYIIYRQQFIYLNNAMQKTHIWIAFAVWDHCEESRRIYSLGRNAITSYTSNTSV